MTDRANMDRPATVLAATIGVVLILVSALLFAFGPEEAGGAEGANTYSVSWEQVSLGANEVPISGPSPATVEADNDAPSNITVVVACTDNPGTPARGAASIDFEVTDSDGTVIGSEQDVPCDNASFTYPVPDSAHPDVAQVSADSVADAVNKTWQNAQNKSTTYTLTFTTSRAASPTDPLPQATPATINGNMRLEVDEWAPTITERSEEEVPR